MPGRQYPIDHWENRFVSIATLQIIGINNDKEVHCLCGSTKIRDTILKEILPKMCKGEDEVGKWVDWFNGHCKDTRNFKMIVVTNTNTQTFS